LGVRLAATHTISGLLQRGIRRPQTSKKSYH
jgi:hypothetical protein